MAPGERSQYSNLGYGLLDHVIARLSGQRYADFMRREVFLPLGMTHASVNIAPDLEAFQAIRYGADGRYARRSDAAMQFPAPRMARASLPPFAIKRVG